MNTNNGEGGRKDRLLRAFQKRSIRIDGKCTSVALEQIFWAEIERFVLIERTSIPKYIEKVDKLKPADQSLASAIRCHILRRRIGV